MKKRRERGYELTRTKMNSVLNLIIYPNPYRHLQIYRSCHFSSISYFGIFSFQECDLIILFLLYSVLALLWIHYSLKIAKHAHTQNFIILFSVHILFCEKHTKTELLQFLPLRQLAINLPWKWSNKFSSNSIIKSQTQ